MNDATIRAQRRRFFQFAAATPLFGSWAKGAWAAPYFAAYLREEYERSGEAARSAGIKPE